MTRQAQARKFPREHWMNVKKLPPPSSLSEYCQRRALRLREAHSWKIFNLAKKLGVPRPKVKFITLRQFKKFFGEELDGSYVSVTKTIYMRSLTTRETAVHEFIHYYLDVKGRPALSGDEEFVEELTQRVLKDYARRKEILEAAVNGEEVEK